MFFPEMLKCQTFENTIQNELRKISYQEFVLNYCQIRAACDCYNTIHTAHMVTIVESSHAE